MKNNEEKLQNLQDTLSVTIHALLESQKKKEKKGQKVYLKK